MLLGAPYLVDLLLVALLSLTLYVYLWGNNQTVLQYLMAIHARSGYRLSSPRCYTCCAAVEQLKPMDGVDLDCSVALAVVYGPVL